MTLTDPQIDALERSFRQIVPISKLAAELFCARFFASDPQEPMAGDDVLKHREAMFEMLAGMVDDLRDPEALSRRIRDLAGRSVVFGVTPAHYAAAEDALLWTLAQALGDAFTPEVQEAWTAFYAQASEEMVVSAYQRAGSDLAAE
ncbi:MAG: globin domain-containing protein [Pseudomonadota bacterium]